ncbi:phosphoribosyltransferase family protein [Actinokineospora alba]|nr:phosphoribosyltransferase family protein [Actinokineospora alba]
MDRREAIERVRAAFVWRGDRGDDSSYADVTGWWRDPVLLGALGPLIAGLFEDEPPTVVLGIESRGCLLGPLVAVAFGAGFVEVRKNPSPLADSDAWVRRDTPPDYRDRQLTLGFPRRLVRPADRVLLVDDWIDTGGQAMGARQLVLDVEATWVGVAVIVDALEGNEVRRRLGVRSLLRDRQLS